MWSVDEEAKFYDQENSTLSYQDSYEKHFEGILYFSNCREQDNAPERSFIYVWRQYEIPVSLYQEKAGGWI